MPELHLNILETKKMLQFGIKDSRRAWHSSARGYTNVLVIWPNIFIIIANASFSISICMKCDCITWYSHEYFTLFVIILKYFTLFVQSTMEHIIAQCKKYNQLQHKCFPDWRLKGYRILKIGTLSKVNCKSNLHNEW